MTKEEFINRVSKINSTGEDEFRAMYNSPEKLYDMVLSKIINKNSDIHSVRLSFPQKKEIVKDYQDYDKSAHCSHTAGEEPSYHFRLGQEWVLNRIKPNEA